MHRGEDIDLNHPALVSKVMIMVDEMDLPVPSLGVVSSLQDVAQLEAYPLDAFV